MPQRTKRIDVTKSFFVTDPNSVMENLAYTGKEDDPETPPPIIAYEGYNFIPTSYGYRSYFGANSQLDIDILDQTLHHCDNMFIFQLANYANIVIALCDDGVWYTESTTVAGSLWVQAVALIPPTAPTMKEWSYCVIKNVLYFYRQGESAYGKLANTDYTVTGTGVTLNFTLVMPSFLNMVGQIGIFRANSSLAFWDSANSIAWSSPLDLADFTPSTTTLAGNAIFNGILGRIVTVKSQGDNFVVYTTKGIVGVRYLAGSTFIWEATTITDTAGISTSKEVTNSITEMEHYAYTNTGIKRVGSYNALSKVHQFEDIIPEIYDLIRELDTNIYLAFLNGRYLFICTTNEKIISGMVSSTLVSIPTLAITIRIYGVGWVGIIDPATLPILDVNTGVAKPMIQHIVDTKAISNYNSDVYLIWRTTGERTDPALETPMNDYVMDNNSNHVPNSNNQITKTVGVLPSDPSTISLSTYERLLEPWRESAYHDLGYRGYGSYGAGIAMLGVKDDSLLAYENAQIEEWTNFDYRTSDNISAFINLGYSAWGTNRIVIDPTIYYGYTFLGVLALLPGVSDTFIAANFEAYKEGADRFVAWTKEYVDISHKGSNVPEINITGVGTSYPIYECLLKSTTKRRLRKKSHYDIQPYGVAEAAGYVNTSNPTFSASASSQLPAPPGNSQIAANEVRADINTQFYTFLSGLSSFTFSGAPYDGELLTEAVPETIYSDNGTYASVKKTFRNIITGAETSITAHNFYSGLPQPGSIPLTALAPTYTIFDEGYRFEAVERINFTASDVTVPEYAYVMSAGQSYIDWSDALLGPDAYPPDEYYDLGIPPTGIPASGAVPPVDFDYTYPGSTFLLQDGVPAPYYPTYKGALVLDTALKKWGKMRAEFKTLVDFSPFNSASGDVVTYTNLGVDMGILSEDGYIYNMDAKPADSFMRYGKIGYFRQGYTYLEEVRVDFRLPSSGTITLESSLSGLLLDGSTATNFTYGDVLQMTCFDHISAKWHTIKISGTYDIQYMEYRGTLTSRR